HYPDRVTDQTRANYQPGVPFGNNGFESTFKYFHGQFVDPITGRLFGIQGYRAYLALLLPPLFGPGTGGWYRLLLPDFVSDLDQAQHQYAYLAPGEYRDQFDASGKPIGYDLSIGGAGEYLVIDAATFQPVADPTRIIGHAVAGGGVSKQDVFQSADGLF